MSMFVYVQDLFILFLPTLSQNYSESPHKSRKRTQRYTFSFYAQSRSSGTKSRHIPLLLLDTTVYIYFMHKVVHLAQKLAIYRCFCSNHDRLDFFMWKLIFLFGQCIAALCILGQCSSIVHFVCTACPHEVSLQCA